jgi:glutamyl-tRNA reductase
LTKHPVSISYLAVRLGTQLFSNLKNVRVLAVGAGDTIECCLNYLKKYEVADIAVANRTLTKAQQLAMRFKAKALSIEDMPHILEEYDLIIAATSSAWPIVTVAMVESALAKRQQQPMMFIDLSVPYNIDKHIATLPLASLYTIDDLQQCIDKNQGLRKTAGKQAEAYIRHSLQEFMLWKQEQEHLPLVCAYRDDVEAYIEKALKKCYAKLDRGQDPKEILKLFSYQLFQKMTHAPTLWIKKAHKTQYHFLKEMLEEIHESESVE